MADVVKWRIYYGDGTTCDTCERPPARGVQAVVQDHLDVGAEIVTSGDYYVKRGGRWWATDINGLFDFLMDTGLVLFGRTVTQQEYNVVMGQVVKDKHGWLPRERKVTDDESSL